MQAGGVMPVWSIIWEGLTFTAVDYMKHYDVFVLRNHIKAKQQISGVAFILGVHNDFIGKKRGHDYFIGKIISQIPS